MLDYKIIEAEVLNEVRPLMIEKYLLLQQINIMPVPKEVIWIIKIIYESLDDIICLYKDINRIKMMDIFVIKLIAANMDYLLIWISFGT